MKNNGKKILTKFITKADLAVLAVYLLGGDQRSVDTEDIAVKCNELAPGQFNWKKYTDQINLKLVYTCLSDAKKPRCGQLLLGSGRKGWRLSPQGLEWVTSHRKHLLNQHGIELNTNLASAGSIDTVRREREKNRLKSSAAWKNWKNGEQLSIDGAKKIFRIDEYATEEMLKNKIVRLRSLFEEDKEIGPFIREAANLILERRRLP